jgi:hypothetical protein
MSQDFPTVGEVIGSLAEQVSTTVIATITDSVVIILPALAVLWAIRYVLAKVGF